MAAAAAPPRPLIGRGRPGPRSRPIRGRGPTCSPGASSGGQAGGEKCSPDFWAAPRLARARPVLAVCSKF